MGLDEAGAMGKDARCIAGGGKGGPCYHPHTNQLMRPLLARSPPRGPGISTTCPDAIPPSPPPEQRLLLSKELEGDIENLASASVPGLSAITPWLWLTQPRPFSRGAGVRSNVPVAGSTASGSCRCPQVGQVIAIHWGTPGGVTADHTTLEAGELGRRSGRSPLNRTARTPCPQSVFNRFCGSSGPRGLGSGKAIPRLSLLATSHAPARKHSLPWEGVTLSIVYFLLLTSGFYI